MADTYERVILAKPDVFVYQIPPRGSTTRAVRAADWQLTEPNWKGRMRIVIKGNTCWVRLEDRISGELFAQSLVDNHPGLAIEPVSDSSRYFVLRLQDISGQHAFVGLGFEDRGDAFDFNVALQDHFKGVKTSLEIQKQETEPVQHKDYSLKAGQKIQINLGKNKTGAGSSEGASKPKSVGLGVGGGLLPPPPTNAARPLNPPPSEKPKDDWGDFESFGTKPKPQTEGSGGGWVQF